MVSITINNKTYKVPKHFTILQACEEIGIQIPRFCYHERLSIAGNCRMCLVEVKNSVKPVASCAMNVADGMSIWTNSLLVKKAREGVMEFLLANHPLDCPICDQGGECDLQDQAMLFGNDRGRFYESKRSVSNKECGPFIKTIMTRCIHCTRCVRFSTELGGLPELGTTGRGNQTEIGNYVSKVIKSEVSGNLIDLCPVGALTSKPYAFQARSWELKKTETIDTLDSMGSNIIAYSSGNKILRILPVLHEGVNEDWINDRTRFNYDGFFIQRLTKGYYRKGDGFEKIDWESLFIKFLIENSLILSENNLFVVGQGLSSKGALALKDFCSRYNDTILDEIGLGGLIPDFRSSFCFNTGYTGLAKTDLCVLAGINLQAEMPLLLMRLRKEQRTRNLNVICFGQQKLDGVVTYNVGNSFSEIVKFAEGKHPICSLHHSSEKPMLIIGNGFLSLPFTSTILSKLFRLFQKGIWNGFNVLLSGSSSYHMYEFGLTKFFKKVNTSFNKISFLNTDGVNLKKKSDAYSFWSSHGSRSSSNFNLILPLLSNYEKDGLFLNNEGRAQFSKFVIKGPEFARTDESVLKSLESLSFKNSKATSIDQRSLSHLIVNVGKYQTFSCTEQVSKIKTLNLILSSEKHSVLADDHISKSSRLLAEANKTMEANRNLHFK